MPKRTKPYLQHASFRPDVELDFGEYPFNIPAVQVLGNIDFHPQCDLFRWWKRVGQIHGIGGPCFGIGLWTRRGTKNVQFNTVDSVSPLHQVLRLARGVPIPADGYFLRAESFFNIASYVDELGYVKAYGGSLYDKSHGEAFMAVLDS